MSSLRALIRRRRATRPTLRRVPVQAYPDNLEREYARAIEAIMRDVHARVLEIVSAQFDESRQDADEKKLKYRIVIVGVSGRRLSEAGRAKTIDNALATAEKIWKNPAIQDPTHPQAFFDERPKEIFVEEIATGKRAATLGETTAATATAATATAGEISAVTIAGVRVELFKRISARKRGLLAQGIGGKVVRFTDTAIGNQIKAVIGVNPLATVPALAPSILAGFVRENVALIKTVPERYFNEVQKIVDESVLIGRRASSVSAMVQERFDVSRTNAMRIARDQIGKLTGQITHARQKALGIDAYVWRTSNDDRVRDTHAEKEGERFTWDQPPADTGHPGNDIQCRCRAEPDLSPLLA